MAKITLRFTSSLATHEYEMSNSSIDGTVNASDDELLGIFNAMTELYVEKRAGMLRHPNKAPDSHKAPKEETTLGDILEQAIKKKPEQSRTLTLRVRPVALSNRVGAIKALRAYVAPDLGAAVSIHDYIRSNRCASVKLLPEAKLDDAMKDLKEYFLVL